MTADGLSIYRLGPSRTAHGDKCKARLKLRGDHVASSAVMNTAVPLESISANTDTAGNQIWRNQFQFEGRKFVEVEDAVGLRTETVRLVSQQGPPDCFPLQV